MHGASLAYRCSGLVLVACMSDTHSATVVEASSLVGLFFRNWMMSNALIVGFLVPCCAYFRVACMLFGWLAGRVVSGGLSLHCVTQALQLHLLLLSYQQSRSCAISALHYVCVRLSCWGSEGLCRWTPPYLHSSQRSAAGT
jgi:hypothetical protein